jgi:D-tyrosyl-tRNA(Tyr) deacylase
VRAVVQRVSHADVRVAGEVRARCGHGLLVLLGVATADGEEQALKLASKVARLRVFGDDSGRFDRSLLDVEGEALVVSEFTLLADIAHGNRPGFTGAAPPDVAEPLYLRFCDFLRASGVRVETGIFGAHMDVSLVNEGPVTIVLEATATI